MTWLRTHMPAERAAVVCHGDYWAGNVIVSPRGFTGLIDWSNAAIAPPEFDLAWNRVQDAGDLLFHTLAEPWRGWLGALLQPVAWVAVFPHRWLYRLFRGIDAEALDYYTAFHCLRILLWSYERQRSAGGAPNPWTSRRARALVGSRFARITGVERETPLG